MSILDWKEVDTVLLDMDGTILDLNFDNYFWLSYLPQVYSKKNNLSEGAAKEMLFQKFDEVKGTQDWYCLDYWTDTLEIDIVALKNTISDRVKFRPQAEAFLSFLNEQEKQVVLVTNAHQKSLELKMLQTQFHQYFDELVSSHQFDAPKEDRRFWPKLEQYLQFDKKRTVFIDDTLSVLESAAEYGIRFNLGIAQPDCDLPAKRMENFVTLNEFKEIMH